MDDLIAFLRARLDDDAELALAASPGPWHPDEEHDEVLAVDDVTVAEGFALSGRQLRATVDHIARHDPARVLAEVDAKRRRLDQIAEAIAAGHDSYDLAAVLLPLEALPYADHPDYQDTWRP
ncbi:DUF6221 family protein [Streptomyces sp. NPDC004285]